jgi:rhodanese-related sulfurtransferase
MSVSTIQPRELHTRITQGAKPYLVDVRTPGEYQAVHVPEAVLIPLDRLDPAALAKDQGVVHLLCQSGGRATRAAEQLTAAGIACCVVEGGTRAWAEAGLPVTRGSGVIALERQVRIGAGSLVVLGVVLALTVHPWCIALSGFVGAGLVFAGITDWCGMGLLLAKAPWNQRATDAKAAPSCCSH